MSKIHFVNNYPADKTFTYDERIALLRELKVEQTAEKAAKGGADEDDYGLIEQDEYSFKLKPNHENGSIYGYQAWTENYCRLLSEHPLYCNPLDAFVGKGFLFLERMRPKEHKWNPEYPYDDLKGWCGYVYTPEVLEAQYTKLCDEWEKGLEILKDVPTCEFKDMAAYGYTLFKASLNQIRYYLLRDGQPDKEKMDELVKSEKELALMAYEIMLRNSAVGYEAANHYYVTRTSFMEKVVNCDYLLEN